MGKFRIGGHKPQSVKCSGCGKPGRERRVGGMPHGWKVFHSEENDLRFFCGKQDGTKILCRDCAGEVK